MHKTYHFDIKNSKIFWGGCTAHQYPPQGWGHPFAYPTSSVPLASILAPSAPHVSTVHGKILATPLLLTVTLKIDVI